MNHKSSARLAMIALGSLGANMVRRLLKDGHRYVVFDHWPEAWADKVIVGLRRASEKSAQLKATR